MNIHIFLHVAALVSMSLAASANLIRLISAVLKHDSRMARLSTLGLL